MGLLSCEQAHLAASLQDALDADPQARRRARHIARLLTLLLPPLHRPDAHPELAGQLLVARSDLHAPRRP